MQVSISILKIHPLHPVAYACKHLIRYRSEGVGEDGDGQIVAEYLDGVALFAVYSGKVNHGDIHADVADIRRFLAVHESNHYGISINCIIDYLNTQFENYNEDSDDKYHYELSYEIMPGDDFIASLKDAKTTSALKLTVSKDVIKDDFMQFANRDEIDDEVEIWIKRPKGVKKFPDNLIKAYYDDLQSNNRIKKISVKGTKASGQFEVDTDLMKMKHYLSVCSEIVTNEVNSVDFFVKAQEFIEEMRNKK